MKKIKNLIFILCFITGSVELVIAQRGITTSGGEASGSGGSVSFSTGQVNYSSAGPGGGVSQGIQQPYEILSSVQEINEKNISVSAYPNPALDFIVIKVKNAVSLNLVCELFDQQGKLLLTKKITGEETNVSFDGLPGAIYFLKVKENTSEVSNFKIIKNK